MKRISMIKISVLLFSIIILPTLLMSPVSAETTVPTDWWANHTYQENICDSSGWYPPEDEAARLCSGYDGHIIGTVNLPFQGTWNIDFNVQADGNYHSLQDYVLVYIDDILIAEINNVPHGDPSSYYYPISYTIEGDNFTYRFIFHSIYYPNHAHMIVAGGTVSSEKSPNFHVRPVLQWVDGFDWPKDVDVTLTIEDYTDTKSVTTCDHNPDQTCVHFELPDGFNVHTGDTVALTDGDTTKTHIITNLAVTCVDPDSDTVSGTADAGDEIEVEIFDSDCFKKVTADTSGNWTADFSGDCDIIADTRGGAYEPDEDGDRTHIDWSGEDITPPAITVELVPEGEVDDDNGRFRIEYSCSDTCGSVVTTTAALNEIQVANAQLVELEVDDDGEVLWDDGVLEIEAPSFLLTVECEDASGNVGVATATPPFVGDNHDDGDSDHDNDDDSDSDDDDDDDSDDD